MKELIWFCIGIGVGIVIQQNRATREAAHAE